MGRQRKELTDKEVNQVATMAGYGMPMDQIAAVMEMSEKTLERRQKDDERVAEAIHKGRARASAKVRQTAYELATSGKCYQMTMFWLKCREGWKDSASVEVDGNGTVTLSYQPKSERKEQDGGDGKAS